MLRKSASKVNIIEPILGSILINDRVIKRYQKHIVESRIIIYISSLIALLLRWSFFAMVADRATIQPNSDSLLWNFIAPLFANEYVSFFLAYALSIGIAFFVGYLNEKYSIIRRRSYLPYAFTIFMLSCFPAFVFVSALYFGLFFLLLSVSILYKSYQQTLVSTYAFRIGFLLAAGSLFTPDLLFYIPFFWLGFSVMRCFKIKAIVASLLGVAMMYWLYVFCTYYWIGLSNPLFIWINKWLNYDFQSFLHPTLAQWIFMITGMLIVIVVVVYNNINSFKDKIQTRAYVSYMSILLFVSATIHVLSSLQPDIGLIALLTTSALLYSHFFSLVDKKGGVYFFVVVIMFYASAYSYLLFK